jgi:hypothetical protein
VEIYSGMHVRIISKVFIVKLVLVTLNVSRCRACEGWKNTRSFFIESVREMTVRDKVREEKIKNKG